jgi:hypothetical protein
MSSPIMPTGDPRAPSQPTSSEPGDAPNLSAFVAELAASERSLTIEDTRGGPPPEVLRQMHAAGRIGEQMRERGAEVRFSFSEAGRVTAELCEGEHVRRLSSAEVFDIVVGKQLG